MLLSSPFPRKLTPDNETRFNIVTCKARWWILMCLNSYPLGQGKRTEGSAGAAVGFACPGLGLGLGAGAAAPLSRANTAAPHSGWAWLSSAVPSAREGGQEGVWQRGDPHVLPGPSPAAAAAFGITVGEPEICDEITFPPYPACWGFHLGMCQDVPGGLSRSHMCRAAMWLQHPAQAEPS